MTCFPRVKRPLIYNFAITSTDREMYWEFSNRTRYSLEGAESLPRLEKYEELLVVETFYLSVIQELEQNVRDLDFISFFFPFLGLLFLPASTAQTPSILCLSGYVTVRVLNGN